MNCGDCSCSVESGYQAERQGGMGGTKGVNLLERLEVEYGRQTSSVKNSYTHPELNGW